MRSSRQESRIWIETSASSQSKREIDDGVFWDDGLRKRSLEEAELETSIWDDPDRARLFYTGTNPSMTLDNAIEKIDLLQEDWVNGRLNPASASANRRHGLQNQNASCGDGLR